MRFNIKVFFVVITLTWTNIILVQAQNITFDEFISIINNSSLTTTSNIVRPKGYVLAYTHKYDKTGWEGYDLTDVAWGRNIKYNSYSNSWSLLKYPASYIKMLYNNSTHGIESVVFYLCSSYQSYINYKKRAPFHGYKYQYEKPNNNDSCIDTVYENESKHHWLVFKENTDETFEIHWYKHE